MSGYRKHAMVFAKFYVGATRSLAGAIEYLLVAMS
jgi:hypothetical protein